MPVNQPNAKMNLWLVMPSEKSIAEASRPRCKLLAIGDTDLLEIQERLLTNSQ